MAGRWSATHPWTAIAAWVVRALLLPATMKLLGPRNWYLPRWLRWLPRTSPSEPQPTRQPPKQPVTAG